MYQECCNALSLGYSALYKDNGTYFMSDKENKWVSASARCPDAQMPGYPDAQPVLLDSKTFSPALVALEA